MATHTTHPTTMSPPVNLPLPPEEPDPAPGCDICTDAATQRHEAKVYRDASRVTDCNVEIRRHPHGRVE